MADVSIVCITYNQEKYIKQCLDGFMMQKTSFKFEVLIHDDASTDGTADIIREYEQKYPNIIKPFYEEENQYSKGKVVDFIKNLYSQCKGSYIAICEGDDYWTDPYKLQKQVDFMERNPEYSVCFHDVHVIHEPKIKEDYLYPTDEVKEQCSNFDLENLLNINFIQTNSVMYRIDSYRDFWKDIPPKILPLDWYVHLMFASKGKIKYMPEVMSVYRRNPSGIWAATLNNDLKKHVCRFCIKSANLRYQVYKNLAINKKDYFINVLFPLFMSQQYYILANKDFRLFVQYNLQFYKIYLLCLKYWYCIPYLIFQTISKLFKKWNNNSEEKIS